MTGTELRKARRRKGWNQQQAAARLGVSQPYLSLLERGQRRLTAKLAERATQVFELPATVLPLRTTPPAKVSPQQLAEELGALGYPGFAYLRARKRHNPAAVLATALQQNELEARLVEALPWVLLRYFDLDWAWLLDRARLQNLQNRLGFLVSVARRKLEQMGETKSRRYSNLQRAEAELERSRLTAEDSLGKADLSAKERAWLRKHRSEPAKHWNVLSDLRPDHLKYAA